MTEYLKYNKPIFEPNEPIVNVSASSEFRLKKLKSAKNQQNSLLDKLGNLKTKNFNIF